jgi:hypothetical protein
MEFMGLWAAMREAPAPQAGPDSVRWRLTANGQYSIKTAYKMFFLGRTEVPGTKELWGSRSASQAQASGLAGAQGQVKDCR